LNILAAVDTVVTNIIAKISVTKSCYSKHFQSKAKLKTKCKLRILNHNFLALLDGILSYIASWRVYKQVGLLSGARVAQALVLC